MGNKAYPNYAKPYVNASKAPAYAKPYVGANSNVQKANTSAPRGAVMPERITPQRAQQREMARTTSNLSPAKQVPSYAQRSSAKPASPKMGMMRAGGLAAGHKSADGVAKKGKTDTKQVTMKKGGAVKKMRYGGKC